MEWRTANIMFNKSTWDGPLPGLPQVFDDVEAAIDGSWINIRDGDGQRTYPSHMILYIKWK
jgi:hypothetical protein